MAQKVNERKAILRPGDKDGNTARWNEYLENVRELAGVVFANGQDLELVARAKTRNRSLAQNSLAHKWFQEIADWVAESHGQRYPAEAWKEYLKMLFLGQEVHTMPSGQVIAYTRHTSDLTVSEFTDFLEKVDHWAAQEVGCQLSHPDDLWSEAMEGQ